MEHVHVLRDMKFKYHLTTWGCRHSRDRLV